MISGLGSISKGLGSAGFLAAESDAEVDFFIHSYDLKVTLFGQNLYFTNTHIAMLFVMLTILIFALFANLALIHI